MEDRKHFFFLKVGHFLDHLFMLIFVTVAALALTKDWKLGYGIMGLGCCWVSPVDAETPQALPEPYFFLQMRQ